MRMREYFNETIDSRSPKMSIQQSLSCVLDMREDSERPHSKGYNSYSILSAVLGRTLLDG